MQHIDEEGTKHRELTRREVDQGGGFKDEHQS